MVRNGKGIEMMVNLINIAYCALKILPYQKEAFFAYHNESAQELRFVTSEQIRQQIFYTRLLQNIENNIKSNLLMKSLKRWIQQQCFHYLSGGRFKSII